MQSSWHTQLTVCSLSVRAISSKVMRLKASVTIDLFPPSAHAEFFRWGAEAFLFSGFGDSKNQAGASLAGNDSLEASSTGSGFCGSLLESGASRSSNFGGEDFGFSAGLVMALPSYVSLLPCVIG
jgi:hypothetical protein